MKPDSWPPGHLSLVDVAHSVNDLLRLQQKLCRVPALLHVPCRLLRAWSFQAKLGIVTNTLLRAAPQLGHLLLVILACILLFACVACVGLGGRVSYLNSAGAAVEETFSVLLGLGSVTLADAFPDSVSLSAAEALLGLLVYYLRVVLFVMMLLQVRCLLYGYIEYFKVPIQANRAGECELYRQLVHGGKLLTKMLGVLLAALTSYGVVTSAFTMLESARKATSAARQLAGRPVKPAMFKESAAPRAG
jgi:hypothetical protein